MNQFGRRYRLSIFGESHGPAIGTTIDGLPPGTPVDLERLQADLDARKPGTSALVTQRKETDKAQILSGVHNGVATGAPVAILIGNEDARPQDYEASRHLPRPGHADLPNHIWASGHEDPRGGGHSSGRLTACLVAAGSLAQSILDPLKVRAAAHLHAVGGLEGAVNTTPVTTMAKRAAKSRVKTAHIDLEDRFVAAVEEARKGQDSVGGLVEFRAEGVPAAWGDPFFDSVESQLAHLLFTVPAVKAVAFGEGMRAAAMRGSQHNDPYVPQDGKLGAASNHAGGILGGRTNGMPLWGTVAVKPASSIAQGQDTVDLATMEPARINVKGRHDPCIAIRAVPVVQACLRIVLADFALQAKQEGHA